MMPEYMSQTQSFKTQMQQTMPHRCVFTTSAGRMGLCGHDCAVGDGVWLLEGGSVPFVLRGADGGLDRFEFLGDCYVHGMMQGELMTDGTREALDTIRIV
jgi:hypothetical protein